MAGRDYLRQTTPDAGTGKRTCGHRPQRLHELVAVCEAVAPRFEPHSKPGHYHWRISDAVSEPADSHEHCRGGQNQPDPRAGHRIQHQKQSRQNQRRSEIPLQKEKSDRERHRHHDRQRIVEPGQVESKADSLLFQLTQELPPPRKIGSQKEDEKKADHFHRLEEQQTDFDSALSRAGAEDE